MTFLKSQIFSTLDSMPLNRRCVLTRVCLPGLPGRSLPLPGPVRVHPPRQGGHPRLAAGGLQQALRDQPRPLHPRHAHQLVSTHQPTTYLTIYASVLYLPTSSTHPHCIIPTMVFYPTIGSTYFVKTQTYVALFGPHQLSIIFSGVMYLELSPL